MPNTNLLRPSYSRDYRMPMMSLLCGVGGDLDRRNRLPYALAKIFNQSLVLLTICQVRYCIHKLPYPAGNDEVLLAETGNGRVSGRDPPPMAMTIDT